MLTVKILGYIASQPCTSFFKMSGAKNFWIAKIKILHNPRSSWYDYQYLALTAYF